MHAHRVDVLDRADHNHVVGAVAHQLELELLPAEDGLLDEHLRRRARGDAVRGHPAKFTGVVRETAAGAAEGEARAYHNRVGELLGGVEALLGRCADGAARGLTTDRRDDVLERLAVLPRPDRVDVRADQADAVPVEDTGVVQRDRGVQRGLATHRREQRVGPLPIDDLCNHVRRDRLHIGGVRQVRVGHDRGRIAVDQHHPQALRAQHPAGLGTGVVELAGLANDDRPGPDDQHAAQIFSPRHQCLTSHRHPRAYACAGASGPLYPAPALTGKPPSDRGTARTDRGRRGGRAPPPDGTER